MVRTIEVAREERERAKFFRIWQTALRSRENHWYSAKVSTVPRQRQQQSSGRHDSVG